MIQMVFHHYQFYPVLLKWSPHHALPCQYYLVIVNEG